MSAPPWLALGVAGALVGGVVVHELAHATAAAVVAEDWRIDWREPATYATYRDDATWEPQFVAVTPLLAGLAWFVGLLLGGGLPTDAWAGLPWLAGAVIVVGGGLDEFRFEASERENEPEGGGEHAREAAPAGPADEAGGD
jgi:hypothetical protein